MTFGELCQQTCKESGIGVSYDQMQRILATQWRLILEELILRPGESRVMLSGMFQLYLKKKRLNCGVFENGKKVRSEMQTHYCFRIKPSTQIRAMMRGDKDIRDLKIGTFPLYFDKSTLKQDKAKYTNGRLTLDNITRERNLAEMRNMKIIKDAQKKKAEEEEFAKKLPED